MGPGTLQKTLVMYSRLRTVKGLPKANQLPSSSWILMTKYRLEWSSCSIAVDGYPSSGHWANSSPEVTINRTCVKGGSKRRYQSHGDISISLNFQVFHWQFLQQLVLLLHQVTVTTTVGPVSGNSLGQTVHAHHASVHQAPKFVAALLRVVGVTAGLAESNGSLLPRMTHVTCRLTAMNRDQLQNPTLCNQVWATFTFFTTISFICLQCFDAVGWASGRASGL